ncbi:MAG: hypothetical protein HDS95_07375 [Bacteroidales bacterium]|nr:hypothetical protein [Bacteroidales bacterium]
MARQQIFSIYGLATGPEIVYTGQVNSIDEVPYENYDSASYEYKIQTSIKNMGGYIVRFEKYNPGTYKNIQWVVAVMIQERNNGKISVSYSIYTED